jgi:hypothetical protein
MSVTDQIPTQSPVTPPSRFSRRRLRWLILGLILALLAIGATRFLRSDDLAVWLVENTGEEDWWEGVKGAVALALIEVAGPHPELAPDAPIEHLGANPYGVNTFLQLEADPANVRRSFRMMQEAGIGWARQQFPWEDIEIHARGDFQDRRNDPPRSAWEKYDRIVQAAEDHGVEIMARLDDPPDWAYANPEAEGAKKGPPDELADYGSFVAAVAERYCGRVRYYQIWNEPNIYPEWGERDVDPAGYAALLKVAAERARAACPTAVIVSAALAPTTEPGGRNMNDLAYLEGLYQAEWQGDFDVLAAQAFGLWTGPTDRRASPDRANFARPTLLRDIMVRHADAETPVWISEFGWDSPPEAMEAPYGRVTEEQRAAYTQRAFQRIEEEWPWAGVSFLWMLRRPDWEWHKRPEGYFRVLEPDWTETATYPALAGWANRFPVLRRGRHGPEDFALQFTGPWRSLPEEGPVKQKVGSESAELQLSFFGTGIQVHLGRPPVRIGASDTASAATTTGASTGVTTTAGTATAATTAPAPAETAAQATDAPATSSDEAGDGSAEGLGTAPELYVVLDDTVKTITPRVVDDGFVFDHTDLTGLPDALPDGEHLMILRVDAGEAWLDEIQVMAPDIPGPFDPLLRWAAGILVWLGVGLVIAVTAWLMWRRMNHP